MVCGRWQRPQPVAAQALIRSPPPTLPPDRTEPDRTGPDGMGPDGMGRDGMGRNGTRRDGRTLTAVVALLVLAAGAVHDSVAQLGVVHALLLGLAEELSLGAVLGLGARSHRHHLCCMYSCTHATRRPRLEGPDLRLTAPHYQTASSTRRPDRYMLGTKQFNSTLASGMPCG